VSKYLKVWVRGKAPVILMDAVESRFKMGPVDVPVLVGIRVNKDAECVTEVGGKQITKAYLISMGEITKTREMILSHAYGGLVMKGGMDDRLGKKLVGS
jgi:hypothetical protein